MKLARSLIGLVVANEPFVTEYFCNLSPPLQGATFSLPADRYPWPSAIAAGGVQIRSVRTTNPPNEMSGYQMDLGDPEWWGCLYDESRRNKVVAKSDINEVTKVLKRNEWNEYVIRCEGKRIRAFINGVPTIDYVEPEDSIPQYGRIGCQVHGGGKTEAWYKDITIEELP